MFLGVDDDPEPVLIKYEDAFQYQNIFAPLIAMEAEYDKKTKEAQTQDSISVRWDMGLNKKRIAYFMFNKRSADSDLRLVAGDELRLKHPIDGKKPWNAVGSVIKITGLTFPHLRQLTVHSVLLCSE